MPGTATSPLEDQLATEKQFLLAKNIIGECLQYTLRTLRVLDAASDEAQQLVALQDQLKKDQKAIHKGDATALANALGPYREILNKARGPEAAAPNS